MTEDERYHQFDLPFYKKEVAPLLPEEVLDIHVHTWPASGWKESAPWKTDRKGGKYMVSREAYPGSQLLSDLRMLYPDRPCSAVCFGMPSPAGDPRKMNAYLKEAGAGRGLCPLMLAGWGLVPISEIERNLEEGPFFGYKVLINWQGDDYGSVTVEDMLKPDEMKLADKHGLVVLLHVPRDGRLADPEVQRGVQRLSADYPRASIVLAHCGRAYLPDEMKAAVHSVQGLDNVYLDASMVMDPTVLQMVFEHVGPKHVLYATDLPIALMRGRRVQVMDHWVDVVLEGYPESAYRVLSNNMRATFMVYEIILAIRRAAEMAGISMEELKGVFYRNGMSLLEKVMDGRRFREAQERWEGQDQSSVDSR